MVDVGQHGFILRCVACCLFVCQGWKASKNCEPPPTLIVCMDTRDIVASHFISDGKVKSLTDPAMRAEMFSFSEECWAEQRLKQLQDMKTVEFATDLQRDLQLHAEDTADSPEPEPAHDRFATLSPELSAEPPKPARTSAPASAGTAAYPLTLSEESEELEEKSGDEGDGGEWTPEQDKTHPRSVSEHADVQAR